jgi:hypothetical protein
MIGKIKVRATVTTLGLNPGDEAEIEVTSAVEAAVVMQHLVVLSEAPVSPEEVPEEAPAVSKRKKAAKSTQYDKGEEEDAL